MSAGRINYQELERRRLQAADLFEKGVGPIEVSRRLRVHAQTAKEWKKVFLSEGREGLKHKAPPGPKPRLGQEELARLTDILLAGPMAYGFENDLWTCPRVAAVIEQEFGVGYHPDHVWKILTQLGFSCQVPERRAREQDVKAVAHWRRYQWPQIKKKPSRKGELFSLSTSRA